MPTYSNESDAEKAARKAFDDFRENVWDGKGLAEAAYRVHQAVAASEAHPIQRGVDRKVAQWYRSELNGVVESVLHEYRNRADEEDPGALDIAELVRLSLPSNASAKLKAAALKVAESAKSGDRTIADELVRSEAVTLAGTSRTVPGAPDDARDEMPMDEVIAAIGRA